MSYLNMKVCTGVKVIEGALRERQITEEDENDSESRD